MKEHGLVFCPEMIAALLAGRKTMTRQPIRFTSHRLEPHPRFEAIYPDGAEGWVAWSSDAPNLATFTLEHYRGKGFRCPYAVGDLVYAKETVYISPPGFVWAPHPQYHRPAPKSQRLLPGWTVFTPRFMPKVYARLWYSITEVRPPEQVQSITYDDILAEGWDPRHGPFGPEHETAGQAARNWWRNLWDSLHGEGAYERNEWEWPLVLGPADKPEGRHD